MVDEENKWKDSILGILKGSSTIQVRSLRKQVLLSLQLDEDDKAAKKAFKRTVQALEDEKAVKLDADGSIKLRKRKKKEDKKKNTKKHKPLSNHSTDKDANHSTAAADEPNETASSPQHTLRKTTNNNPQGVTRLFLGNLPFAVDEQSLQEFLSHSCTHIKWITDKETGKFYGSAFVEMKDALSAGNAVAKSGEELMNRPIKINFAPARPGDKWPPEKRVISGNNNPSTKAAGGSGVKAMSAKPDNCTKLFIGNLSYDIDDETITKFFGAVDAEVKAIRWLHHKESGSFKGVGFVDFWNTEACEKAATLNGKTLLGRPIRIDWTD